MGVWGAGDDDLLDGVCQTLYVLLDILSGNVDLDGLKRVEGASLGAKLTESGAGAYIVEGGAQGLKQEFAIQQCVVLVLG